MHDKLFKNRKLHNNYYIMPFLNRKRLLCLIWSFNFMLFKTIHIAFKFFYAHLLFTVGHISNNKPIKAMIQVVLEIMYPF